MKTVRRHNRGQIPPSIDRENTTMRSEDHDTERIASDRVRNFDVERHLKFAT